MNTYKVTGLYTISFEMEIEAENREEAYDIGEGVNIMTEWNGGSVFSDEAILCADGMPFDVDVELIDGEEEDEDEE